MEPISMVDLRRQYSKAKDAIDAAIQTTIDAGTFIKGPQVGAFESAFAQWLGVKHVVTCANGTDAITIALLALGLKPGDEVIVPSFSFIATAEAAAIVGLKPVFADVDPVTFNIDCATLKKLLTTRTRAIIPVHLFGQCADMKEIGRFADRYDLHVIEDAAQSVGSGYMYPCGTLKKTGTLGTVGCTSFFPSKNLGCYGDGGALMTNDDALALRLRSIANHGMQTRYYHDEIGMNSRLDSMQAAILSVKLSNLNAYNEARQAAAQYYDRALAQVKDLVLPTSIQNVTHVYHQYTLKVKHGKRDALRQHLENAGIPSMVYYPVPLHQQKAFLDMYPDKANCPVSEQLCTEVLSLPMHTELDETQLQYITNTVISFFGN